MYDYDFADTMCIGRKYDWAGVFGGEMWSPAKTLLCGRSRAKATMVLVLMAYSVTILDGWVLVYWFADVRGGRSVLMTVATARISIIIYSPLWSSIRGRLLPRQLL